MSNIRAVVEVKWLLAAFPEAEMRGDVVFFNGSAFPVTVLESSLCEHGGAHIQNKEYWATDWDSYGPDTRWADPIE